MHADVRYWPKADIPICTAHVRFRGKADTVTRPLGNGANLKLR